jgi:hypothetical protein
VVLGFRYRMNSTESGYQGFDPYSGKGREVRPAPSGGARRWHQAGKDHSQDQLKVVMVGRHRRTPAATNNTAVHTGCQGVTSEKARYPTNRVSCRPSVTQSFQATASSNANGNPVTCSTRRFGESFDRKG